MKIDDSALNLLLEKLDAEDRNRAGEKYLILLDELANFLRLKNCSDSQTAAEDALDRTARKIAEGENILNVRAYAFRVAKFVLLENHRQMLPDELPSGYENRLVAPETKLDARLEYLDECLTALEFVDREIIINYYDGEGRGKADLKIKLAARFDLSMTALKLRALRARQKLEKCINKCLTKN